MTWENACDVFSVKKAYFVSPQFWNKRQTHKLEISQNIHVKVVGLWEILL